RHQYILQALLAGEHVGQVVGGAEAQQHIHIGEAQVGIQQYHPPAHLRQGNAQVDREVALANATFATGNGDNLHWAILTHAASFSSGAVDGCRYQSGYRALRALPPRSTRCWAREINCGARGTAMSPGTSCPSVV